MCASSGMGRTGASLLWEMGCSLTVLVLVDRFNASRSLSCSCVICTGAESCRAQGTTPTSQGRDRLDP